MKKRIGLFAGLLCMVLLLAGCTFRTVEDMYCVPKRSESYSYLQKAIESAMGEFEYAAPISGENQQTVQMADLDGDGIEEYILFARTAGEKPMQILIFSQTDDEVKLSSVIESHGSAFEQVEYVNFDDQPGKEVVVGRQVSDQVLRSMTVYTFASGEPEQLLTANYLKFLTCDLNQDEKTELMVIQPGQADADSGAAVLYSFDGGELTRSREAELSGPADAVKRIMVSALYGGNPAVYVASAVEENAIITDIFAIKNGVFTNISFSNESGTSVQTLRNYYVYADDVDDDGVLELPDLITMRSHEKVRSRDQQYLIRWYAMDIRGREIDKCYTFHNFVGGWYMELDESWAERVSVVQNEGIFEFYVWDEDFETDELLFSIQALTGNDREEAAAADSRFVLYRADSVLYAARLESAALRFGVTQEDLIPCFRLIHQDWKTGET